MATTQLLHADHLFDSCTVEFSELLRPSSSASELLVRTLSGTEVILPRLAPETSVFELRRTIAEWFGAPPFTLQLVVNMQPVSADDRSLFDAGLFCRDTSVVVIRRPACRGEWLHLFHELVRAIHNRDIGRAKHLVDMGAGFDDQGNILKAAANNAMRLPGDLTCDDGQLGNTMLHLAIREGLETLSLYLIALDVDVNTTNECERSPLVLAVIKKQGTVINALLESGADPCAKDYLGNTALAYSLRQGNDMLSARLLSAAPLESQEDAFIGMALGLELGAGPHFDPVLKCCAAAMPLTVHALLELRASVNGVDDYGRSCLHYARAHSMSNVVTALLNHGVGDGAEDARTEFP